MTDLFLRRVGKREPLEEDPIRRLTDRELEIFRMIGKGMTTQQIAHNLDISPKTVESHREKIKAKLDLKNAAVLAQRAVQWVLENG
jgi:DNA-binding CsgD family transcriptional regulator